LEKNQKRRRSILKWLFKLLVSALAIYLVARKIDFQEVLSLFPGLQLWFLLLAFLFFNISKILSAFRFQVFMKIAGVTIPSIQNLKLYYLGMFYNLFLPGGIGGDGYKIYILQKFGDSSWKELTWGTVIERFSGLAALLSLLVALVPFTSVWQPKTLWMLLVSTGVALPFVGLFLAVQIIRKKYNSDFLKTSIQSYGVQGFQLVCSIVILLSLGITSDYTDYLLLFLVSSMVAVIPFTIGGVGARELVFVYAGELLNANIEKAVAFSLIFFLITAVSSLSGVFFEAKMGEDRTQN
jgi:hypothetical protein